MITYEPHPDNFTSIDDAREFVHNLKDTYSIVIEYDEEIQNFRWVYFREDFEGDWKDLVQKDVDNFLDYCKTELLEDPQEVISEVYTEDLNEFDGDNTGADNPNH